MIYRHLTISPERSQRKESCLSTKPPWRNVFIPQTWQPRVLNVDGTRELRYVVNLPITPTFLDEMYRWSILHTKKWQFALALGVLCQPFTKKFVVNIDRVFRSLFKYSSWRLVGGSITMSYQLFYFLPPFMVYVRHHEIRQACQRVWMFGQSLPHMDLRLLCLIPQFLINVGQGGFGQNSLRWAAFIWTCNSNTSFHIH